MRKGIADEEEEAMQVAFAIAKTMKKRGIFNRYGAGMGGLHINGEMARDFAPKFMLDEVTKHIGKQVRLTKAVS